MSAPRYAHIDGLRAIAALSVLVEHMLGDMLRSGTPKSGGFYALGLNIVDDFSFGRFGVVLFFLISGFVVPFSLKGDRALGRFAITRACRLYPAMWLALVMLGVLAWRDGEWPGFAVFASNLTMAPALFGKPWMSEIYWTLFIELIFYGMIAVLYRLDRLKNAAFLALVVGGLIATTAVPAMLIVLVHVKVPLLYVGLHLSFLVSGLLLRLSLAENERGAGAYALVLFVLQTATIALVSDLSVERGDRFIVGGRSGTLFAYLAAFTVFAAAVKTGQPRWPWLAAIGKISYSIYLFHWIVNVSVYRAWPLTGHWNDLQTMAVCVVLVLVLASVVYTLVERPMMVLGHALSARSAGSAASELQPITVKT